MNFIEFLTEVDQPITWIERYTQFLFEENKKILFQGFDITETYIKFAIFKSLERSDHRTSFISSVKEKAIYFLKKVLSDMNIPSESYNLSNNKIEFFNGSTIDFLPLNLVTNHTIEAETLLVDVDFFPTKTSEYIVFHAMNSPHKPFNILCSINNMEDTVFFKEYFDFIKNTIPIIKNFA